MRTPVVPRATRSRGSSPKISARFRLVKVRQIGLVTHFPGWTGSGMAVLAIFGCPWVLRLVQWENCFCNGRALPLDKMDVFSDSPWKLPATFWFISAWKSGSNFGTSRCAKIAPLMSASYVTRIYYVETFFSTPSCELANNDILFLCLLVLRIRQLTYWEVGICIHTPCVSTKSIQGITCSWSKLDSKFPRFPIEVTFLFDTFWYQKAKLSLTFCCHLFANHALHGKSNCTSTNPISRRGIVLLIARCQFHWKYLDIYDAQTLPKKSALFQTIMSKDSSCMEDFAIGIC